MTSITSLLLMVSLTYLVVEASTPCGPKHCGITCAVGQVCKDKKLICVESPDLGKEDVCCSAHSCAGKIVNNDQPVGVQETKTPTGAGYRLSSIYAVIFICAWAAV
eukprot:TRINITY_DN14445_c0_g1_i1.p1 TRINITY_DN14445_c0_g1~~TRINITY_DN14445_c0_g1_i1.p1  ORF type:complete len:106 (-),score=30.03 TRINITY_DN14445_c0_g1_i1:116-433(-)